MSGRVVDLDAARGRRAHAELARERSRVLDLASRRARTRAPDQGPAHITVAQIEALQEKLLDALADLEAMRQKIERETT